MGAPTSYQTKRHETKTDTSQFPLHDRGQSVVATVVRYGTFRLFECPSTAPCSNNFAEANIDDVDISVALLVYVFLDQTVWYGTIRFVR